MEEEENIFIIRIYTKAELAHLYNPQLTTKSALQVLRRWILHNQELHNRLTRIGYQDRNRSFTPRQVETLVEFLGEP